MSASHAVPLRVTVLMAEEAPAFRDFVASFSVGAAKQNLSISITQATSLTQEADLVIAVGMRSAAQAINTQYPTLCVLVPKSGFEKLVNDASTRRDKNSISAIYIDQPHLRHFELISAVLPDAKKVGVLYSGQAPDFSVVRKATIGHKYTINAQHSKSGDELYRDLQQILQNNEVLLSLPDASLYNATTIRNVLLETYRVGVPVIGFSAAFVRAGAVAAVFSTPEKIAAQTLLVTQQFIQEGKLSAPQYPNDFDTTMNQQVARSLGIPFVESAELVRRIKSSGGPK